MTWVGCISLPFKCVLLYLLQRFVIYKDDSLSNIDLPFTCNQHTCVNTNFANFPIGAGGKLAWIEFVEGILIF